MDYQSLIANSTLVPQSYGINMAQCTFGRPTGIWLECTECPTSHKIKGSLDWEDVPTSVAAKIFLKHGWSGKGENLTQAKCPVCSKKVG